MRHEFWLPSIGDAHSEAEIRRWLVNVGEHVALDQDLVEVETAKATIVIPSPHEGVLLARYGEPGDVLKIGALLAVFGDPGELPASAGTPSVPAGPSVASSDSSSSPTNGDLSAARRERLSMLRRTISGNLTRTWREVPHVTLFAEAHGQALLEARRELALRYAMSVPLDALLVKVTSLVLAEHPHFLGYVDGDELVLRTSHDIGVAVDTPDGLIVPVIRNADSRSVSELASDVSKLAQHARARTIAADQLTGNAFTVSNLGAAAGTWTTSILPPQTAALLSVGRAGSLRSRADVPDVLPLNLTIDHRALDGGAGARFLNRVTELIEGPTDTWSAEVPALGTRDKD